MSTENPVRRARSDDPLGTPSKPPMLPDDGDWRYLGTADCMHNGLYLGGCAPGIAAWNEERLGGWPAPDVKRLETAERYVTPCDDSGVMVNGEQGGFEVWALYVDVYRSGHPFPVAVVAVDCEFPDDEDSHVIGGVRGFGSPWSDLDDDLDHAPVIALDELREKRRADD